MEVPGGDGPRTSTRREEGGIFQTEHRDHQRPVEVVVAHLARGLGDQGTSMTGRALAANAPRSPRSRSAGHRSDRWSTAIPSRVRGPGGPRSGGPAEPGPRAFPRRRDSPYTGVCRSVRTPRRSVRGWSWPGIHSAWPPTGSTDGPGCATTRTGHRGIHREACGGCVATRCAAVVARRSDLSPLAVVATRPRPSAAGERTRPRPGSPPPGTSRVQERCRLVARRTRSRHGCRGPPPRSV